MFQFMLDHPNIVVGGVAFLGASVFIWALCAAAAISDRGASFHQQSHVRLVPRDPRPYDWARDDQGEN